MKLRYKAFTDEPIEASQLNVTALMEVLTGDDSVSINDLDVEINGEWKDLRQAFRDRYVITDNNNTRFSAPRTEDDRQRGYTL